MLELVPNSPELKAEIDEKQTKVNGTNAIVVFKNGSYIKVVTASDSSRGNRCNILIIDEFRLVRKDVIDTILRKFLTLRRMPRYEELSDDERKREYDKERNKICYLSSAFYQDSWSYVKCLDTFKSMMQQRSDFICGLPYQLSIREGLLDSEVVADEMLESDFNEIKFSMEYEAVWYGSADGAFFEYNAVAKNRRIKYPMLPARLTEKLKFDSRLRIPARQAGEKRILSADIALMASTRFKNDATAIHITQIMPTKADRLMVNLMYSEVNEGLRTEEEALNIRRLYEEFDCDYIVLDARNVGLSIYDCMAREMTDSETGEIFPALSCCNNADFAARCTERNAPKVIWAIMGSPKFNSECAFLLREGFKSGNIRLLLNEYDGEDALKEIKGFSSLLPEERLALTMPYINTTLLIDELVNLKHEEFNGMVRLYEKSGMRKDRYSSLSYNYYVAIQLEKDMRRKSVRNISGDEDQFIIRAPSTQRKGWY